MVACSVRSPPVTLFLSAAIVPYEFPFASRHCSGEFDRGLSARGHCGHSPARVNSFRTVLDAARGRKVATSAGNGVRPCTIIRAMSIDPRTLLAALSADEAVSGSALATRLHVTRAAVWKQIEALRALGAPIEAAAGRGYRLAFPLELLDAARIGAELDAE